MLTGKLVVGVTGASGAIYAQRFLSEVARHFETVYLVMSEQAIQVASHELGVTISRDEFNPSAWLGALTRNVHLLDERDYFTPPASGSFRHDGMVVIPCSMGTLGRIAHGISNDLLTRAADVCLKEGRKLVLVPREMPLSLIMIRNMATAAEAGATIVPAMPSWYGGPKSLEDLADTVVARVLNVLGVEQALVKQWMAED